jgi:acyl-CoA thioester hydrolase
MPRIHAKHIFVGVESIDALGHVNNREYLRWMEEAALEHTAAQGWPTERYLAQGQAWVAGSHQLEYLRPAREGEALVLHTWVEGLAGSQSRRRYAVLRGRDGKLLARGQTQWVYVDLASGRAIPIPPEVAGAFEPVPEGDEALIALGLARRARPTRPVPPS